jgi:TolA-binding protein
MTRADNSHHLAAASARRSTEARRRAQDALLALQSSARSTTVSGLATAAGVSRSWLYTQPDLIAGLRQLTNQARTPRSTPATERSLQVRLAAALASNQRLQHRITALTEQTNQQRRQLERTYAELRRLQSAQQHPDET